MLVALQLRPPRLAHCHAPVSALPPGASLGGVAPPRDAILLVRAKRMQKRAKGRSPLWHPPWGGVDGLRCLYRFSQVPSAPARESLRENFVGPTRSTRAAVPLRLRRAGFPRVMPASTQPFPACPRSSAPRGPRRGITMQSAFPTRSQKSSGAGPARLTGVARGHPVRGNGSWERSVPFPLFAKRLQNHCRGYLPGVGNISADFISGRGGFKRGKPFCVLSR